MAGQVQNERGGNENFTYCINKQSKWTEAILEDRVLMFQL